MYNTSDNKRDNNLQGVWVEGDVFLADWMREAAMRPVELVFDWQVPSVRNIFGLGDCAKVYEAPLCSQHVVV